MQNHSKKQDGYAQVRSIRASISFPEQQYLVLEKIAAENKVSLAWVVRDAIDDYLKAKWPLFTQGADCLQSSRIEVSVRE